MLNFLKNSKGEILNLFFKDESREYYLREIATILGKEASSIKCALEVLLENGIVIDNRRGPLRFFKLNKEHVLYSEIKAIISKTLGLEVSFTNLVDEMPLIKTAFIFGSMASGYQNSESDVDLMLIGQVNEDTLIERINKLEKEINRPINYHIYSKEEFRKRIRAKERFFVNILSHPVIKLKGNLYEYTKL